LKLSRNFRIALIAVALVAGLSGARLAIESLDAKDVYGKDFIQEYVLARAIRAGLDPYLPVSQLVKDLGLPAQREVFPHPTPHTPIIGFISLPLAWLSYRQAAAAWMVFEVLCLIASIVLLMRWWGMRPRLLTVLLVTWAGLGWAHVWEELVLGQFNTWLLLLFTIAWLLLREEKQVAGGVMLGFAVALKFLGWPIVVYLAMRRKWAGAIAAGATVAVANLIPLAVMRPGVMADYVQRVAPVVMELNIGHAINLSLWSVGWKLFSGMYSPMQVLSSPPLVFAPGVAKLVGYALPLVMAIVGLRLAMKMRRFDAAYGLLVPVSLLVSPIFWGHYLIIAVISFAIAARDWRALGFPKRETRIAAILVFIFLIPGTTFLTTMRMFAGGPEGETVPLAVMLLGLIPTAATAGWVWLSYRLSTQVECVSSPTVREGGGASPPSRSGY
jgi:hypothetical protein